MEKSSKRGMLIYKGETIRLRDFSKFSSNRRIQTLLCTETDRTQILNGATVFIGSKFGAILFDIIFRAFFGHHFVMVALYVLEFLDS